MTLWLNSRVRIALELAARRAGDSYVVGGAVRDSLIGSAPCADLDLAVEGDGYAIAREVANAMRPGATFVPLDRDRGTGRIVLTDQETVTIDVSSFKGPDIYEDLRRRDFTINAVAVKISDVLQSGMTVLLDPLGGVTDLKEKTVRICSTESFRDDPIRILRAFRFSCTLGFVISPETAALVSPSVDAVIDAAPERIRDEFFAVLSCDSSIAALREMDRYGVLDAILPELRPMKGCEQNEYHHLDVWDHSFEAIERLEWIIAHRRQLYGTTAESITSYLLEEPVLGRPRLALLKLVALFHDSGKPHTRTRDAAGRIHFYGHEKISRDMFIEVGRRLKLSRREVETGAKLIEGHMRPMILTDDAVSMRAIYRLCRRFDKESVGLFLVFLADLSATRGPARPTGDDARALERTREVLDWYLDVQPRKPPLVNGHDLMRTFGLAPGPHLGALLKQLVELQDCGQISTKEQALAMAETLIKGKDPS